MSLAVSSATTRASARQSARARARDPASRLRAYEPTWRAMQRFTAERGARQRG